MRRPPLSPVKPGPALAVLAAGTLAACTAQEAGTFQAAPLPSSASRTVAQRSDVPVASMSGQYARPRSGAVAATGASAWVEPAPAPAFVASGPLPPAAPPAPPPAAVANRQPASPATPASDIVRPEAATPDAPPPGAAAADPALREQGRALFNQFSCNACHTLADAGSAAGIGPSLDRNANLTREFVASVIVEGRGAMPSFGGQMSEAEIAALADYIVEVSRK